MLNLLVCKQFSACQKRILFFLMCVAFCFFFPLQSFAAEPIFDSEWLKEETEAAAKPNLVEKYLTGLLVGLGNAIITIFHAQDVSALVFQRESVLENAFLANDDFVHRSELVYKIFPEAFFSGIESVYSDTVGILPIPMVIILGLAGLVMLVNMSISPENRTRAKEIIAGSIAAVVLIKFGYVLFIWIIDINFWIVDLVHASLEKSGVEVTTFLGTLWNTTDYDAITSIENIGVGLMVLVAFMMTFVMNYQYMMRMLTLGILIMVFPIVVLSLMLPTRRSAMNIWFGEFTAQVFMQAAHALALGLVFFSVAKMGELSFWVVLASLIGMPALSHVLRKFVGAFVGEGAGFSNAAANMSGLGSAVAMATMAKRLSGRTGGSKGTDAEGGTSRSATQSNSLAAESSDHSIPGGNRGSSTPEGDTMNQGAVPTPADRKEAAKERRNAMLGKGLAMAGVGGAVLAGTMVGGESGGKSAGVMASSFYPSGARKKQEGQQETGDKQEQMNPTLKSESGTGSAYEGHDTDYSLPEEPNFDYDNAYPPGDMNDAYPSSREEGAYDTFNEPPEDLYNTMPPEAMYGAAPEFPHEQENTGSREDSSVAAEQHSVPSSPSPSKERGQGEQALPKEAQQFSSPEAYRDHLLAEQQKATAELQKAEKTLSDQANTAVPSRTDSAVPTNGGAFVESSMPSAGTETSGSTESSMPSAGTETSGSTASVMPSAGTESAGSAASIVSSAGTESAGSAASVMPSAGAETSGSTESVVSSAGTKSAGSATSVVSSVSPVSASSASTGQSQQKNSASVQPQSKGAAAVNPAVQQANHAKIDLDRINSDLKRVEALIKVNEKAETVQKAKADVVNELDQYKNARKSTGQL